MNIRALRQAIIHGLILEKVNSVIEANQETWPKPDIDINKDHRTKAKNNFNNNLFKVINRYVFGKFMENVKMYRDIKFVTTDRKRSHLVSQIYYHTTIVTYSGSQDSYLQ